jgi:hypothetical protein
MNFRKQKKKIEFFLFQKRPHKLLDGFGVLIFMLGVGTVFQGEDVTTKFIIFVSPLRYESPNNIYFMIREKYRALISSKPSNPR